MPKLKTHSGTKDRVRVSKNGKVRVHHSHVSHFLQKKSAARKRTFAGLDTLTGANSKIIKQKLGA
ncbi:MAG TPA: bL35 family ribosomal protein [Bacillota bacterium]|nr:bL35 family ribosomal protein [Bacillota bacterium]HSX36555.1 bL35 family ribosomal protein [Patescibacteria group bacterium]